MFAVRNQSQPKKSAENKSERTTGPGSKEPPEPNPLWQSLALSATALQAKLAVSQPDDPYEQEADRIADRVMSAATTTSSALQLSDPHRSNFKLAHAAPVSHKLHPKGDHCEDEEERLHRKVESHNAYAQASAPPVVREKLNSPGRPLDPITRSFMEERFDQDFGRVRVHTDARATNSARSMAALAYAVGSDIVFGENQYAPETTAGRHLLAHELTHTIQQQGEGYPVANNVPGGGKTSGLEISQLSPASDGLAQREPTPEGDVIPEPVDVIWGGDPFNVSFERKVERGLDYFYFTIKYTGPQPAGTPSVIENSIRMGTILGSGKLNARVKAITAGTLVIDLEGYGDRLVTLADKTSFDSYPSKGRRHDFDVKVLGESVWASSLWVKDPKAKPEKPLERLSTQDDIPGEKPKSMVGPGNSAEIRIDGDGDQSKELLLRIKPKSFWPGSTNKDRPKTLGLQITQLSSGKTVEVDFDLKEAKLLAFNPTVEDVTDGKAPTRISLVWPSETQWLLLHPPLRDDKGVTYLAEATGRSFSFSFPPEQTNKIVSAGAPVNIGGIKSIDVTLGSYNDHFRITVQSQATTLNPASPPKAIFGISALYRGQTVGGGMGAEIPKLSRNQNIQSLESGGIGLILDIDGEKEHNLRIYDQLTSLADVDGGGPPEKNRNHHIRVVGDDFGEKIFYFTVRDGYLSGGYANPSALDRAAESNALAISGLSEQAKEGTFEKQVDAYEGALMAVRRKAADEHLIQKETFDQWQGLSTALIKLRPQVNANKANPQEKIDPLLQVAAATHATMLYDLLAAESKGRNPSYSSLSSSSTNPYTGETTIVAGFYSDVTKGPGAVLSTAVWMGQWGHVYSLYAQLVDGLDHWIVDRLKETKGESSKEAQQAELLSKRKSALSDIESKKPIAVYAVFHPDKKFETEAGYVSEVPLALYAYKDDDTWYLKNLTNPDKPYHLTTSPSAGGEEPPIALFNKLNDPDRFPVGRIHYDVPGRYGGEIKTQDYLTWKKFFTYLGLGLAAVGITLATLGTGTVAVVGAWALAGSALAGGVAAGIDLAQGMREGDLTTTRIFIDIGQIVASVAGVSALKSGMIVRQALTAAEEGAPLMGRAAELAVFFQKVYVVSTSTRIAADVVTIFAFSVETAKQLDEIQNGPGSQADKDRAKALILSQLAGSVGLLGLSIKGELPQLGGGRKLILHFPDKNGPPVANVGGMEAPGRLKYTQKDVGHMTGDKKLTIEELTESIKKEWKGSAIDVVEFPDGSMSSLDNRRLLASELAAVKEIPVAYHSPNEPFPPARAAANEFELTDNIRRLDDGTLVVGGTKGTIAYPKGFRPTTFGEAVLVRTAKQKNVRPGERFPLWGSYEKPRIRYPKSPPKEE